ncbi:hypothetical protein KOI35_06775 [Actinoplanes bogorensis]|uniref:Lipoprotein n=1 Tax=Paractinoplanes bogorensis TaxID=1610840 RepID=A0ABS5YIA7_9ACTN|nr:hypothetical protein [Actinoplanes bogorensis]MBU2663209.1 hypothetical protein [Actinoplanes bogorensis]
MRRALLAVLAGGLLLTGAACDSDANSTEADAPAPTAPSTAPSSAAPDYTADTKQVCAKLQTMYTVELKDFGAAMGKLITYREAKQTAEAAKAETAAATELKQIATKIRKDTAEAENPEFKAAGLTSAAKIDASAANRTYIKKTTTMATLDKTIEGQLKGWLSPVTGYCAA